jgi:hypothetical protein
MNITPLRAVRLAGFLLVALCVLSPAAAAKGPEQAYLASPSAAGGISRSSVSDVQCPCNAGLPDGPSGALSARLTSETIGRPAGAGGLASASVSDAQCPCNAGLPVRQVASVQLPQCPCNVAGGPPGGLPAILALHERRGVPAQTIQPRATTIPSRGTFDWADASVGAAVTLIVGLLVAGGALLFGRRRVRGQLGTS